ncbi:hypothetical protein, partial [Brevundimonas sp.]|uniref:hypothetical protein n=1 Tax=Brevundimonas sp. TaxID=1871086 RepID=UPI002ED7F464
MRAPPGVNDQQCCGRARVVLAASAILLTVSGCATARTAMGGARQFGAGFGAAAMTPLEDFNLRREQIPPVLLHAAANPYDLRGMGRCGAIAAEVARLDDALGPDTAEPPPPRGSRSELAAAAAAELALDAVRDASTDFIPGRSWVRLLTGAERHSRRVQSAVQSGLLRRAFLKGTGMQRNCAPPAAPS